MTWTPETAAVLGGMGTGLRALAFDLSVFFHELVRLEFTRDEALELTKEWQRGFFASCNAGHAGEEEA